MGYLQEQLNRCVGRVWLEPLIGFYCERRNRCREKTSLRNIVSAYGEGDGGQDDEQRPRECRYLPSTLCTIHYRIFRPG